MDTYIYDTNTLNYLSMLSTPLVYIETWIALDEHPMLFLDVHIHRRAFEARNA
jgi:hypothetical protein